MNQMFKKASSVLTAVVCAASITFSGASLVLADGEIDDQTKTTIETTAEGLTETIIPLTDEQIEAYMESGDDFTENAMTAWNGAKEELGDMKETGSVEIEYSNDEYTATVPVTFEKEDAEFIYVFDKNLAYPFLCARSSRLFEPQNPGIHFPKRKGQVPSLIPGK